ncbi:MAG: hypothetical protein PHN72_01095 [Bacilli bacterium]|nr:hypothetical protein [Bacilli bacterium]
MVFFRSILAMLDGAVYGFLAKVYELLMKIANVEIFNYDTIQAFATRVYALLGILMAFKLIFSFINYVVNPDAMSDSKTGGKKLVINIIVSLVLLIAVPTVIFPMSKRIQKAILQENVLQELILGVDGESYSEALQVRNASRNMAFSVLNAFIYPSEDICTEEESNFVLDDALKDTSYEDQDKAEEFEGDYMYKLNGTCAQAIVDNAKGSDEDKKKMVVTYERAYTQKSVKSLLSDDIIKSKTSDGEFVFDYKIIISLIGGLAVVWILLIFCFQIALRTVKLGFLELIAPIPVISLMDTKAKAKSFDGWVKACISTYVGLFVRLAAIYFAIFVITLVTRSNGIRYYAPIGAEGGTETLTVGPMVTLFIIIGALMFASELPKLIESIFGVKLDGKFSLNPLKGSPIAAGVAGSILGAGIGAVGGGFAGLKAGMDSNAIGRGLASGIFGGAATGFKSRGKDGLGGFNKAMDSAYKNFTGKEYSHMSMGRIIQGIGGKKRVDAVGGVIKNIGDAKNQAETKLSMLSHRTNSLTESLQKRGINTADLSGESSARQSKINSAKTPAFVKAKQEYSAAQKLLSDLNNSGMSTSDYLKANGLTNQDYIKAVQDNTAYSNPNSAYMKTQTEIESYENDIREMEQLQRSMDEQTIARHEVGELDRKMGTAKDEKKDVQRMFNQDESPREKYKDIVKDYGPNGEKVNKQ